MLKTEEKDWGIHWFRRDLRVAGNEVLRKHWQLRSGRLVGLFCFDSKFLGRSDFSYNRFAFFLKSLAKLREELALQGGELLVVDQSASDFFSKLKEALTSRNLDAPISISWGKDYEPYARDRDARVENQLVSWGRQCLSDRDHLLIEPNELLKDDGTPYRIYSPFARKWFELLSSERIQERIDSHKNLESYVQRHNTKTESRIFKLSWKVALGEDFHLFPDALDAFKKKIASKVSIPIPEAGIVTAFRQLKDFLKQISEYKERRDFPADSATSKLSIFFKNGSLTGAQAISGLSLGKTSWKGEGGSTHFVKELAWREFYYSILFHFPEVENKSFISEFENLTWENREDWFEKWKNGMTGFPIVDAGMRELMSTGWMHNRVRMIVASFLTKDLLIDWKWGENHFMKELLDGDLAPNNGGWQWAASTGCDPQPYFRIFNPWLQGERFDPNAIYIRKHIPELAQIPVKEIHDPQGDRGKLYPVPIVDHSDQKKKALAMFGKAKKSK